MANKEKQEYDYEGDMAMSQLKSIIANAQRMHDMLKVDTNLPEWVQSKITLAEDYISTASNYMQGEMSEEVNIDKYADSLIKRDKQNLSKSHVVHAARVAGVDHKKLMAAVNQKVGRIKEEAQLDELSGATLGSYVAKSRKDEKARKEHGIAVRDEIRKKTGLNVGTPIDRKLYSPTTSRGAGQNRAIKKLTGQARVNANEEVQIDELSKTTLKSYMNKADARTMDRTIDNPKAHKKAQNRTMGIEKAGKKVTEEIAVNSVGAGNVAGLQGEPPVRKKKKNVMTFNRFMKK
jgi:hypothetical protein